MNYKNFDSKTGKKLNPICEYCWVKKIKNYTCGFEKCPGRELFYLEKSATERGGEGDGERANNNPPHNKDTRRVGSVD